MWSQSELIIVLPLTLTSYSDMCSVSYFLRMMLIIVVGCKESQFKEVNIIRCLLLWRASATVALTIQRVIKQAVWMSQWLGIGKWLTHVRPAWKQNSRIAFHCWGWVDIEMNVSVWCCDGKVSDHHLELCAPHTSAWASLTMLRWCCCVTGTFRVSKPRADGAARRGA